MNSLSSPLGGSAKTATRFETPLCTRSAASSAPAPPESIDRTMISAGPTGWSTTSAHPAARKAVSRSGRTAAIANAANASAARTRAHPDHPKILLRFMDYGAKVRCSARRPEAGAQETEFRRTRRPSRRQLRTKPPTCHPSRGPVRFQPSIRYGAQSRHRPTSSTICRWGAKPARAAASCRRRSSLTSSISSLRPHFSHKSSAP